MNASSFCFVCIKLCFWSTVCANCAYRHIDIVFGSRQVDVGIAISVDHPGDQRSWKGTCGYIGVWACVVIVHVHVSAYKYNKQHAHGTHTQPQPQPAVREQAASAFCCFPANGHVHRASCIVHRACACACACVCAYAGLCGVGVGVKEHKPHHA